MSSPVSPPPVTKSGRHELPAYVSNGLIGLRVLDILLLPGIALVNGFAGVHPTLLVEEAAQAPYPIAGDISIDGVWLSTSTQQADFVEQRYDFAAGEVTTRFTFTAEGTKATIEVLTFCSRKQPTLVLQQVSVEVASPCNLVLRAMVDVSKLHGRAVSRHMDPPGRDEGAVDGSMDWESLGGKASCGIAHVTELVGDADVTKARPDWGRESSLATDYSIEARPGRTYRLRQIASMVPSVLHHDPERAAIRFASRAGHDGFDAVRDENHREWEELWKGRIVVDTDDDMWQQLTDAAFFYLNSSVHPSAPSST